MKRSKWHIVSGETTFGNYSLIKEEDTGKIVAEFPAVSRHASNERFINLRSIVNEHNSVVKQFNKTF